MKQIPIAKPELDEEEVKAATEVIKSGWIIQGARVAEFEKAFADFVGASEAIAVSSGTAALHIALLAAGCEPGTTVICPSYSFIATANVIRHCGAEPIFVDIDPKTYNMNPDLLEEAVRPNTRAILAVHQVGFPADLEKILAFAEKRDLKVIEDAACAIGSEYRGVRIGRPHALAACFSFHPRKIITTGDGGMVTTSSKELADRARRLRQHGIGAGEEKYSVVGYNYRLTDLQAALGVEQMKKLPRLLERRREQAARYTSAFSAGRWLLPQLEEPETKSNYQSYQLRLSPEAPVTRNRLLEELKTRGITAQPGIRPIHLEPIYKNVPHGPLDETERAAREVVMLPLYNSLSDEEQDFIIRSVLEIF
jgi:perosamine synthetase